MEAKEKAPQNRHPNKGCTGNTKHLQNHILYRGKPETE